MLFGKRRWAVKVAQAAALAPASDAGRATVALLVVGPKKAQRLVRGAGPRGDMDDLDFIMRAARALSDNPAAAARLQKALAIPLTEAERMLAEIAAAAIRVYQGEGRDLGVPRPPRVREPWSPPPKARGPRRAGAR
jgi:hypothetical protein